MPTHTFLSYSLSGRQTFDGTLIRVSHDRDFLDGLADKVFEFDNKCIKEHLEDINNFLPYQKRKAGK